MTIGFMEELELSESMATLKNYESFFRQDANNSNF